MSGTALTSLACQCGALHRLCACQPLPSPCACQLVPSSCACHCMQSRCDPPAGAGIITPTGLSPPAPPIQLPHTMRYPPSRSHSSQLRGAVRSDDSRGHVRCSHAAQHRSVSLSSRTGIPLTTGKSHLLRLVAFSHPHALCVLRAGTHSWLHHSAVCLFTWRRACRALMQQHGHTTRTHPLRRPRVAHRTGHP